jgi:hypothetical protein
MSKPFLNFRNVGLMVESVRRRRCPESVDANDRWVILPQSRIHLHPNYHAQIASENIVTRSSVGALASTSFQ